LACHPQRALGNLLFDSGQLEPALRCFEQARIAGGNAPQAPACRQTQTGA